MLKKSVDKCPFCGSAATALFEKNSTAVQECGCCSHRFAKSPHSNTQHVQIEFSDEYFSGGKSCYDNYDHKHEELKRQGRYYSNILKRYSASEGGSDTKPSLLDIGCAAGYMLQSFVDEGWHGVGIEANAKVAGYGSEHLKLEIHNSPVEEFQTQTKFDAATMIQVLPHLVDPIGSLQSIRELLKSDGLLMIETWDCQSLTARGFGKWWHEYNPPSVLHWFTRNSLQDILAENGFEVLKVSRPTKWISPRNGFAVARKATQESLVARMLLSPTRLIPNVFKVPYFLDDVFWILARKQA